MGGFGGCGNARVGVVVLLLSVFGFSAILLIVLVYLCLCIVLDVWFVNLLFGFVGL